MAEVKMEVDVKPVNIKVETDEALDQKVDISTIKMEIVKEEPPEIGEPPEVTEPPQIVQPNGTVEQEIPDVQNLKLEDDAFVLISPKEPGLAYLECKGMVVDAQNENLTLNAEEVRDYIEKAVLFQIQRKKPLAEINQRARRIHEELYDRHEDFQRLSRLVAILEKNQIRYLCTDKVIRKFLKKTGGVGVDLPILANAVNAATNQEAFLKNGLSPQTTHLSRPTSAPSSSRTTTTTSVRTTSFATPNTHVQLRANSNAPKQSSVQEVKPIVKPEPDIECIDLTDESETPSVKPINGYPALVKHPAPLPPKPFAASNKEWLAIPPKPRLKAQIEERGIVLQWDMIPHNTTYAKLSSFDIFGYHEQKNVPINTLCWKKIGTVAAMTLPMACTLNQFIEGNTYYFSIRAVDVHNRCGGYSEPSRVVYNPPKT